ncbi:MAG: methyl-accepting chemotaxis protein, partial [Sedimenticola sp.]|nr:methyl-accepting chemotaxis protein [Sedimenticola sp.]
MNQASNHVEKGLSISTKIDLALIFLFLIILLVSAFYQFNSQRNLVEELVMDQTETLADSYFDNVNTLMLTGGMANKEIARKK